MLALVKEKAGSGFVVKDVEIPKCKPNEVLIKVDSIGICGSDIPIFNGIRQVPIPFIPGHEFSGVIVETGSSITKYKKGDKVIPSAVQNCLTCNFCREGLEVLCDNLVETGIHVNGAFAEYVVVPEHTLHKMPENMTFLEGTSIDPIASAYHAVKKANIGTDDVVAIFGPGPIGLFALQVAKLEGAKKVIMIGTRKNRLSKAKELGADITINMSGKDENIAEEIKKHTGGKLPNAIIEATGNSSAIEMCLASLMKNGRLVLAGVFHDKSMIPPIQIVRNEYTIKGSICYSFNDFENCIELVSSGKVQVKPIISHELSLKEAETALKLINSKEAIKVVLHP